MDASDLSCPKGRLYAFEDIIDGYFPLQTSLGQMMGRLGAAYALLNLSHAPIINVPDLPPDAPVPLNIRSGTAGVIETLLLEVFYGSQGSRVIGWGSWHWLNRQHEDTRLDPMTRLAEPAYLFGVADRRPKIDPRAQRTAPASFDAPDNLREILAHLGAGKSSQIAWSRDSPPAHHGSAGILRVAL